MKRDVLLGAAVATAVVMGLGAAMQGGPAGVYQVVPVERHSSKELLLVNTATGEVRGLVRLPGGGGDVWSPVIERIDQFPE